ncbi:MAG: UDP-3-O-(3-hydroxymyristoyl)glucosamine N-acyltransferase [Gammaproteobacteria bacterium]|nr:UDP-3-O-(3-hydroxymyristoyl)glucosamine N-acyltransferase [Gammaproteobacteria bacterium]
MSITVGNLFERFKETPYAVDVHRPGVHIGEFSPVESWHAGSLVFTDNPDHLEALRQSPPAAVVTSPEIAAGLKDVEGLGIIVSENVELAHAVIRQAFDDVDYHDHEWPRIHDSAVIHDSARVPDSATIGPGAVLGRDVVLGERVAVQSNVVVEAGVVIGDDTRVLAGVFIGRHCRIGHRVLLKPGCIIGAEGFGFARDDVHRYHRIPQKGIVVIEDDVVVSAGVNIDRATYLETRISSGTRIDALCHVGHNVFVDENCVLVAQTGIAGSAHLGKRVIASGQTAIVDHRTIADDVVLVHRAGVTEDIAEAGMYAAAPTQPFREYTRNMSVFRKLYDLLVRVRKLEKRMARPGE